MRVLLVHGLGRTPASLVLLHRALRRAGHVPASFSYYAFAESYQGIRRRLVARLQERAATREPVALIGHPLGGLLLRHALAMTHSGDGVYKSTDAGKTWKKIGLPLSQHISRIIVHPKNPDIVWIAAQGALYSSSKERGIYKSTDGGATWKNTLFVDEKTGAAELSMDMNNPRIMYAAMWEHGRLPWKVVSGGPGSGLYNRPRVARRGRK